MLNTPMLNTIMLVDDSEGDLLFTSVIVERAGIAHRGVQFNRAELGLEFLRHGGGLSVDAILLDIHMPGLDGFGFLDAYEALLQRGLVHAPVTMLSGSEDPRDRDRALAYDFVRGFATKPMDIKSALGLAARVSFDTHPISSPPQRPWLSRMHQYRDSTSAASK
jgi:CheY-like chemotaxis protein